VNTQIEMCGQLIMGLVLFMKKLSSRKKNSHSTNLLDTYTMAISITFMYLQVSFKLIEEISKNNYPLFPHHAFSIMTHVESKIRCLHIKLFLIQKWWNL
jgi:hypothetical protein